jgi:hypothetical protein
VGGQSIADFDPLCPQWTRNMEMTTPDRGLVMRTEADFGIVATGSRFASGSGAAEQVRTGNGGLAGTVL